METGASVFESFKGVFYCSEEIGATIDAPADVADAPWRAGFAGVFEIVVVVEGGVEVG